MTRKRILRGRQRAIRGGQTRTELVSIKLTKFRGPDPIEISIESGEVRQLIGGSDDKLRGRSPNE